MYMTRSEPRTARRRLAAGLLISSVLCAGELASASVSAAEVTLQQVFSGMFGAGQLNADAFLPEGTDSYWEIPSSPGFSTVLIEIAGYQTVNTFGLYDPFSGAALQVFSGWNNQGDRRKISVTSNGVGWDFTVRDLRGSTTVAFTTPQFGLYLDRDLVNATTLYSDSARNARGGDQMRAFVGSGQTFLWSPYTPSTLVGTAFTPTDAILAWEDIVLANSDKDYQDMVILMRGVSSVPTLVSPASVVPLPAALWLLGLGFIGYIAIGYGRARGQVLQ